jgi:hypothetical protein
MTAARKITPRGQGRTLRARADAVAEACSGSWGGTAEAVDKLIHESMHVYGWRPARAALLYALADLARPVDYGEEEPMWMSGPEFARWRAEIKLVAKARKQAMKAQDFLGVSDFQVRLMEKTGAPKWIALACAHALFGHDLPVPADDVDAFREWYDARFRAVDRVAAWLGVGHKWLSCRMSGFEMVGGQRAERSPSAGLIRACDWLWRMGPYCPYGPLPPVELWPGQGELPR